MFPNILGIFEFNVAFIRPCSHSRNVGDVGNGQACRSGASDQSGESYRAAPVALECFVAVGAHLYGVTGFGREVGEAIGSVAHGDEVGFVAVEADLPLGFFTVGSPSEVGTTLVDVADHQIGGHHASGQCGECAFKPYAVAFVAAAGAHLHNISGFRIEICQGWKSGRINPRQFEAGLFDVDVIDIEQELVGAAEVADSHIALAAAVGTQVNGILIPVASTQVVTAAFAVAASQHASALGGHRPFLDGGEVGSVGVTRG